MRQLYQPIKVALICLTAGLSSIRLFEYHQLYLPNHQEVITPKSYQMPYQDVWFMTKDGVKLHGWWVPSPYSLAPIILLCHGQGGNISDRLPKVLGWRRLGASVFLFDYRGYGKSEGDPSEEGLYRDGDAAYHWVRRRFPERRIFIYGASLGGGVATELAVEHPAAGLILEDTFTSIEDMANSRYSKLPVGWLVSNRFDNISKISKITMPVMIFHSQTDEVVPFDMGRRLYEAAPAPKYFVRLSGPHDLAYTVSRVTYDAALSTFLANPL